MMNASIVHELTGAGDYRKIGGATGVRSIEGESPDGTLFSSVFNSAVEGIKTTNASSMVYSSYSSFCFTIS